MNVSKYYPAYGFQEEKSQWMVRMRNPFVLARVSMVWETPQKPDVMLFCWPPYAPLGTPHTKFARSMRRMAAIWLREAEGHDCNPLKPEPNEFSYGLAFPKGPKIPSNLFLQDERLAKEGRGIVMGLDIVHEIVSLIKTPVLEPKATQLETNAHVVNGLETIYMHPMMDTPGGRWSRNEKLEAATAFCIDIIQRKENQK